MMCTLYPLPELSSVRFAALFHSHFCSARGRSLLRGFAAAALALLLLPLLLPQTAAIAETIPYGSNCGDLTCTLDTETGALTISGTGAIPGGALYEDSTIQSVTIEDGVASIGNNAFYRCTNLKAVSIPDSLLAIDADAFGGCTSLSTVNIPSGLTSLGEGAFKETAISSADIPSGVKTIGKSAFELCHNLTNVTIAEGVETIGESAFFASGLTSIDIPKSVRTIEREAFKRCENLASVTIAEGVETIGESAFTACPSLLSVTIPSTVTSIGAKAFLDINSSGFSTDLTIFRDSSNELELGESVFKYSGTSYATLSYPDDVTASFTLENGSGLTLNESEKKLEFDKDEETGAGKLKTVLTAKKPAFSPESGASAVGSLEVTITAGRKDTSIYYTTDGSEPTQNSTLYTGPVTLTNTATVKAIAVREGISASPVASADYTVTAKQAAISIGVPSFDTVTYGYAEPAAQTVTIQNTGTGDAEITDVELSGKGADSFILTGTAGITVKAGSADSSTFAVQPAGGLDAGTYTAEITVTYSGGSSSMADVSDFIEFTVEPKPLSEVTVALDPEGPFPYDGEEHSVTVTARDGEKLLTESVDYEIKEGSVTKATETGTYEVIVEGVSVTESEEETAKALMEGNYIGTVTLTWQITDEEQQPEPEPEPEPRRRLFRFCEDCELPATGFSSVSRTALRSQPAALRYEPARMRLMLPTLEQDVELVTVPREENSWAVDWLGGDAGILAGSALPGEGTAVIAAHNTLNDTTYGPFAMLAAMDPGDRIFVRTAEGDLLSYAVYANELLAPDDLAAIESLTEENALVLVTCENESTDGGYLNRRAVFAK